MARTIPLIRAANLLPLVRWIESNRYDAVAYLARADLGYWFNLSPEDPIPVLNGIALLQNLAEDHGPNVGIRIVTQSSIAELAFIGRVALGSRTPAEALQRISMAIPLHSSHETIQIESSAEGILATDRLRMDVPAEGVHAVHVLMSTMIEQLCRFTGLHPPLIDRIEMVPHPRFGLSHVTRHFGACVYPSRDQAIRFQIHASVARNPFRVIARDRLRNLNAAQIPPLAESPTLSGSLRPVLAAMLHGGEPTIARVARAGGMSVRSLQRWLADEETSFSRELDIVRRRLALQHLRTEEFRLADLSERLGYSNQSALTRAVRRLTGATPRALKSGSG